MKRELVTRGPEIVFDDREGALEEETFKLR